jgi:hypothetical protein
MDMWKALAPLLSDVSKEKPAVGRIVRIMRGKHKGAIGPVERHIRSKFVNPYRYGSSAQHAMIDARGRYGFAVLVSGFWTDADNVMVCVE